MTIELNFSGDYAPSDGSGLLFDFAPATDGPVEGNIAGTFPAPTFSGLVLPRVAATISALMPGMTLAAEGTYSSSTQRPTVGETKHAWQVASGRPVGAATTQQDAPSLPVGWAPGHRGASPAPAGAEVPMPNTMVPTPVERRPTHKDATPLALTRPFDHDDATPAWLTRAGVFQNGTPARNATLYRHQDGDRTRRISRDAKWQVARLLAKLAGSEFQGASPWPVGWTPRHQDAVPPPAGITLPPAGPGTPGQPPTYSGNIELLFQFPLGYGGAALLFGDDAYFAPAVTVPIKRVYMQVNVTSLRRIDGNILLPATTLRLSLDVDSWVWSFNASLPMESVANLEPASDGQPVELEANVNGKLFHLLVERMGRDRSFGRSSVNISGRGKAALLDAPYAPLMNFTHAGNRTIHQLMGDVLSVNGVPMPWTINLFSPEDWLVPAGVFAHRGTYISALNTLAAAAGAYVQPHAASQQFDIKLRYPHKPWEWDNIAPDIELPTAPVTREGIEWLDKPRYNRVYVYGAQAGVRGQVTRAGTAGNLVAPMIVDPLITAAAAARQRGLPVLAEVGRIAKLSLRMPLLAETGVITPGKFVRYVDGETTRIGLVRGVDLDVSTPAVWQTISLETHVEPV